MRPDIKEKVMKRISVVSSMVMAAVLVSAQAMYAAPAGYYTPVSAFSSHMKKVTFTLRNDSKVPMKVKIGDNELLLAPGKPLDVKAVIGETVVVEEASATQPAGTVLATVMDNMNGATVVVR
jgi:hypothetical protein